MRRTSRSSVPWRRESRVGGSFLVDILPEYCVLLVECQLERLSRCASSSSGPTDGPHLPTLPSPAVEAIAAVGLEPRHAHPRRHLEPLEDLARSMVHSPH